MGGRVCIAAIAVVLATLSAAGCGGGGTSDEQQVRDVVTSFVAAGKARDAKAACALLSSDRLQSIASQPGGGSCASVLGALFAQGAHVTEAIDIQEVRIEGDRATVDATYKPEGSRAQAVTILVVKEDGEWKLASVGL